jgi:hypothetical protein
MSMAIVVPAACPTSVAAPRAQGGGAVDSDTAEHAPGCASQTVCDMRHTFAMELELAFAILQERKRRMLLAKKAAEDAS